MVGLTFGLERCRWVAVLKREEILGAAESAVTSAVSKGADEAEAYVYEGFSNNVEIERGQIARSSRIVDQGLGIRAVVDKAVGFAYTNMLGDKNAVEETLVRVLSAARASRRDEDWRGFPARKSLVAVERTFDQRVVELGSEDLVKHASSMLDAAERTEKRVFPIEGGVGASSLHVAVANSNGVGFFGQGTFVECSLATVAQDENAVTPVCFEFNAERSYSVDPEWVGREAARLAVSALKSKTVETRSMSVVFTQFALSELLSYTLVNAVKADYVQRNQSALKDKVGERVASEKVTFYDDGLFAGGLRTWMFDGEGVPQQRTPIIEKGVLRNFLYDNYCARKEGKESTGNASRAGYLSTPSVDVTNFRLMPGTLSSEELLQEVDDGLIVYYLQGAHSSNPVSGDFSVVATPAWRIRKGEVSHATRGVMLAGNIFEVLKNVVLLADNERKIGQIVAPWVLVEKVKVIGK
jgi:PmbA protein